MKINTTRLENILKDAFGEKVNLIHFDNNSRLIVSSRERLNGGMEYMVHTLIYEADRDNGYLQNGNYFYSFEDAIFKYLKRKDTKLQITVPLSEEDLSDLQSGKHFEWTFESDESLLVDVTLGQEQEDEYQAS